MSDRPIEILLVESDRDLCDMLLRELETAIWCRVTVAESASAALREELTGQHDLVVVSADLPDDEGLGLVRHLRVTNDCPMIVMSEHTSLDLTLTAIRSHVIDWFQKPFDIAEFTSKVKEAAEAEMQRRRDQARFRRLRRVAARIIREREDLNQRMDLLCRDLVQAYKRLAEKITVSGVLEHEKLKAES